MLAFRFLAEALGVSQQEGKARWAQAQQRLQRRQLDLPPTTRVKPPGARQATPQLAANDAAKALRLVLKRPLEEFFEKEEKLVWLRGQIAAAGGDPATVDAELSELLAERAQQEADLQSLALPGLRSDLQVSLRTTRENGEVLGSILDYLRWLGVEDEWANSWRNWIGEAFRELLDSTNAETHDETVVYIEKQLPNQSLPTPFTNFAGYRLLAKLCLHKSKIAQAMYDQAMTLLGRHAVGDQRLHASLDANAAETSEPARAFVLGSAEAAKQAKKRPLDLDDFERGILEDDSIDPETAAKRMAKAALLRRHREASCQQLAVFKKQTLADLVKYDAEKRAEAKLVEAEAEVRIEEVKAASETKIETMRVERDKVLVERARVSAEKRAVEEEAKAQSEQRERQRVHAAELAAETRRAEIRDAAARGAIPQQAAEQLLDEGRQTLILRLEEFIRTRCGCPNASSCSAQVSKMFNEAVEVGRHVKPPSHSNEAGRWKHYVEHDGPVLARLHQELHDRRNGVRADQPRLSFAR
jgi:hypothetical protein